MPFSFNPRAPRGARREGPAHDTRADSFQSTRPARGATQEPPQKAQRPLGSRVHRRAVAALVGRPQQLLDARIVRIVSPAPTCRVLFVQSDRKSTRLNSSHLGISYAVF